MFPTPSRTNSALRSYAEHAASLLDEIAEGTRVLRASARHLNEERAKLFQQLQVLQASEDLRHLSDTDLSEINARVDQVMQLLSSVHVTVAEVREPAQAEAFEHACAAIVALEQQVETSLASAAAPPLESIRAHLNAVSGSADEMMGHTLDERFQSLVLGCSLEDQKALRSRLRTLLQRAEAVDAMLASLPPVERERRLATAKVPPVSATTSTTAEQVAGEAGSVSTKPSKKTQKHRNRKHKTSSTSSAAADTAANTTNGVYVQENANGTTNNSNDLDTTRATSPTNKLSTAEGESTEQTAGDATEPLRVAVNAPRDTEMGEGTADASGPTKDHDDGMEAESTPTLENHSLNELLQHAVAAEGAAEVGRERNALLKTQELLQAMSNSTGKPTKAIIPVRHRDSNTMEQEQDNEDAEKNDTNDDDEHDDDDDAEEDEEEEEEATADGTRGLQSSVPWYTRYLTPALLRRVQAGGSVTREELAAIQAYQADQRQRRQAQQAALAAAQRQQWEREQLALQALQREREAARRRALLQQQQQQPRRVSIPSVPTRGFSLDDLIGVNSPHEPARGFVSPFPMMSTTAAPVMSASGRRPGRRVSNGGNGIRTANVMPSAMPMPMMAPAYHAGGYDPYSAHPQRGFAVPAPGYYSPFW